VHLASFQQTDAAEIDHTCQREHMNGYFNPLRRKVGVVTLVLACVFAAGWVRSSQTLDQRFFQNGATAVEYLQSDQGAIVWVHLNATSEPETSLFESCLPPPFFTSAAFPFVTDLKYEGAAISYGFAFHSVTSNEAAGFGCRIPYGSIVIPLTLLSAWLLISKPRAGEAAKQQADS
jgi:hypothetical protein